MASSSSSSRSGGISFFGVLQILFIGLNLFIFIGLKLTGHISWPWWQVLLPSLITSSILGILLLVLGGALLYEVMKK